MVKALIYETVHGTALADGDAAEALEAVGAGSVPDGDLSKFLAALSDRGETVDELVGAATVLRRHSTRVNCEGLDAIDTCGTGGDGISTFNVSTAAAIVAAAAGAKVAKHGNCSHTRRSG